MDASEMKTIEIPAIAEGDYAGKSVKVMYDKEEVTIVWLCGGSYRFTKEGLGRALENFQAISKVPEVLYRDADKSNEKYIATLIEDGEFAGDDNPNFQRAMKVPWKEFEAALQTALGSTLAPKRKPRARKVKPRARKTT